MLGHIQIHCDINIANKKTIYAVTRYHHRINNSTSATHKPIHFAKVGGASPGRHDYTVEAAQRKRCRGPRGDGPKQAHRFNSPFPADCRVPCGDASNDGTRSLLLTQRNVDPNLQFWGSVLFAWEWVHCGGISQFYLIVGTSG